MRAVPVGHDTPIGMSEDRVVFSTDPKVNQPCPKCKELAASCTCPPVPEKLPKFLPILRIDKTGRSGRIVTVIDGLPKVEMYLKDWTKALKNRVGSGGTYRMDGKEGIIEIQGDKRELIRTYFENQGIKTKG